MLIYRIENELSRNYSSPLTVDCGCGQHYHHHYSKYNCNIGNKKQNKKLAQIRVECLVRAEVWRYSNLLISEGCDAESLLKYYLIIISFILT